MKNKEELIEQLKEQVQHLEKALEDKRAEIERVEKQDRLKKYADIEAGTTFIYKGHEYTKLRNSKAIINDYDSDFMDCPFDNVNNIYNNSLIEHYINSIKFLKLLGLETIDFDIETHPCFCELLSEEEYEASKDMIKNYSSYWWLRFGDYYNSSSAYYVSDGGFVYLGIVYDSFGVRPSFNFVDDIEVEVVE